jgi:hypothetical protein
MALKLATVERGIPAEYHKIIYQNTDYRKGTTQCVMGLYIDQTHRESGVDNYLKLEPFEFFGIDLTREQLYDLITLPKPVENTIVYPDPAGDCGADPDEPIVEDPIVVEEPIEELKDPVLVEFGNVIEEPIVEEEGTTEVIEEVIKEKVVVERPTTEIVETNMWALAEDV